MKRLIPATVLLVVIIIICVSTNAVVENICGKTGNLAYQAEQLALAGDFDKALAVSEKLRNQWEDGSKLVVAFVNHKLCDELSRCSNRLYYHCLCKNTELALSDTSDIKTLLHQIISEQKISALSFY